MSETEKEVALMGRLNVTGVPAEVEQGVIDFATRFGVPGGKAAAANLLLAEGLKSFQGKDTLILHARA